MQFSNKIVLSWLAVMWVIFSVWVVSVTSFPLNLGFVGMQSLTGIALMWTTLWYKNG
jgi:hypothetical protein